MASRAHSCIHAACCNTFVCCLVPRYNWYVGCCIRYIACCIRYVFTVSTENFPEVMSQTFGEIRYVSTRQCQLRGTKPTCGSDQRVHRLSGLLRRTRSWRACVRVMRARICVCVCARAYVWARAGVGVWVCVRVGVHACICITMQMGLLLDLCDLCHHRHHHAFPCDRNHLRSVRDVAALRQRPSRSGCDVLLK